MRKSRADKTCQFWHALQRKRELLYHEYRPLENMPILASRVIGRWRVLASAPRCVLPNLENYRIPYFYKLRAYLHEIMLRSHSRRCSGNPGNQSYSFDFHPVVTPLGVHCKLLQTCFYLHSNTPIDLVFPENLPSHLPSFRSRLMPTAKLLPSESHRGL